MVLEIAEYIEKEVNKTLDKIYNYRKDDEKLISCQNVLIRDLRREINMWVINIRNNELKLNKIVHKEDNEKKGYYMCNHAIGIVNDKSKLTNDWNNVTCRNCLNKNLTEKIKLNKIVHKEDNEKKGYCYCNIYINNAKGKLNLTNDWNDVTCRNCISKHNKYDG